MPSGQPPKYPPPRPGQRLGTPNPVSPLAQHSAGGSPGHVAGPGVHGAPPPGHPQAQLAVPDPFTRKISRHPKKFYTQSSSRFAPKKPPSDYKPLPLLKGEWGEDGEGRGGRNGERSVEKDL